ncbi:MAG TPA: DNA recombination protein RmuC [Candidatus Dojkabacteria bacterium]|nr:DNA recombination protein RmuC [Candidatus Dojkabacteria bacterium]HQF36088.1 DNA recombination protein RmuC [Candidatus Dojkabacteria bacterium]
MEYITIVLLFAILIISIFALVKKPAHNTSLEQIIQQLIRDISRIETVLKDEMARGREESSKLNSSMRTEIAQYLKNIGDSLEKRISLFSQQQTDNFEQFSQNLQLLTEKNEKKMSEVRETIEKRLELIQKDNTEQLERMRNTVDEKLTDTLDKRLGEKFKLVNDRLEQVYKGLGEMQTLATGVGDLKKVLTNVKTRGTWGEIQLGNLLDQMLTKEQYEQNITTKRDSKERVEYAIKIPSKNDDNASIWLPIDAKFPMDIYNKLASAQEEANVDLVVLYGKELENFIKQQAKTINEKYIDPPYTTDFAILYLPIEGLYAEVTQRPGLCEFLQTQYRVTVTGPNTIAAFLNSLQMGFRTLAIEKRSSEVWETLGVIKNEFGKFGMILEKAKKKIQEAGNVIDEAGSKTRSIESKLKKVETLPITNTETANKLFVETDQTSI